MVVTFPVLVTVTVTVVSLVTLTSSGIAIAFKMLMAPAGVANTDARLGVKFNDCGLFAHDSVIFTGIAPAAPVKERSKPTKRAPSGTLIVPETPEVVAAMLAWSSNVCAFCSGL